MIANISRINRLTALFPRFTNFFLSNSFTSRIIKNMLGFAPERNIPLLYKTTLLAYLKRNKNLRPAGNNGKKVYLFVDEFTDFNDVEIGIKAVDLLVTLGYKVEVTDHAISGRTYLSKGLIRQAKELAIANVNIFKDIINEEMPLIGIEPSAILSFRDEYPDLVGKELKDAALELGKSALMFDEFIASEIDKGNISADIFTKQPKTVKLHGHCHQKAIASIKPTVRMLSLPENYKVDEIKSGCCGMAGSFGYEKEHYDLSMKVGELVLFPAVRAAGAETLIAAPGTSCRNQILDGTGRTAFHPIEILFDALNHNS
jgi:Fe-S oxidoreductase